jgi:hypothetical protein
VSAGFCPLSLYLILLFFWGHMHWPFWSLLTVGAIIYGLGWGALAHVSIGGIFDVAEKTDHVTQSVHQHGQLPYDDASEEDDHQRQPCEIAHSTAPMKPTTQPNDTQRSNRRLAVRISSMLRLWVATRLAASAPLYRKVRS